MAGARLVAVATAAAQGRELSQSLQQLQQDNLARQSRLSGDPSQPLRVQFSSLEQRLQQLDQRLRQQTLDLIPAEQMPLVLERVLASSGHLKLVSLTSLPPEPLLAGEQAEQSVSAWIAGCNWRGSYFEHSTICAPWKGYPNAFIGGVWITG